MMHMNDDLKHRKEELRAEARRARSLLMLNASDQEALLKNFFDKIEFTQDTVIAAYWPMGRELDTHALMDECNERGLIVVLPIIEKDSRILKFARWSGQEDVEIGPYKIVQPVINENTEFYCPDVVIVPLLAFDRKGYRLGYGGGYYDSTLEALRNEKEVTAVGWGYAKQACLFNLPVEEHDIGMDWIVTEQSAQKFI